MNADFWVPVLILAAIAFFSSCAAMMLGWSVKTGQFENTERSAASIFDEGEPIGETTDRVLK
jgi:cbb3-type cytochrome oxidase maturation protein